MPIRYILEDANQRNGTPFKHTRFADATYTPHQAVGGREVTFKIK